MHYKFHHSIVGGTFDRFHAGHQKLLTTAFENSEKVTIGITTNEMFRDKSFFHLIEDYTTRERSVSEFLSERGFTDRSKIIPIHDIYGNSLEEKNIDAIFVTESTKPNAEKINKERKKISLDPLEIVTVSYVLGEDDEIISSERIRKGLIDREGKSYLKLFTSQKEFHLPDHEREALRKPIGIVATDMQTVLEKFDTHTMLIAVGDIVAVSAHQAGRMADINIIDGKTRRHILEPDYAVSLEKVRKRETGNPPGTVTQKAAKSLLAAITDFETTHAEQLIVVFGEEDLLAISAILLAPLDSVVVYGQFDQGIVVVHVSEQNKKRVQDLFRKFK